MSPVLPRMLTYPISSLPSVIFARLASRFAYCSSIAALLTGSARYRTRQSYTHLSFQKPLSSSIVLMAPRMRANNTSTPPSPRPQKALQKSRDRLAKSGEPARAYRDREVVDAWRRADIVVVVVFQAAGSAQRRRTGRIQSPIEATVHLTQSPSERRRDAGDADGPCTLLFLTIDARIFHSF